MFALFWLPATFADNRRDPQIYVVAGNYEQFTALDRYHRAFDADDMEANAVYALRTTLVRELLHTRQELKYFIGGKQRGQKITKDKSFTFEFFHDTCELYVENCYPSIAPDFERPYPDKGNITYVRNPLYDIHQTIDDIYSTEIEFDPQVRKQLIFGMLQLSALMTRLDRFIIFYQRDVWQHKKRLPLGECGDTANQNYLLFQDNGQDNCLAKLQGKAQKIVEFLQFYRAMIIDNYHLLISPVRHHSFKLLPLYQHIYKELERVGFPASNKQLSLTNNFRGLPRPEHFEKEQNLADMLLREDEGLFKAVAPHINELIDLALIEALKANSSMLESLGKEIHYLEDKTKFLQPLTCDHRLWNKTSRDFSYLEPVIDFKGVQKKLSTNNCQPKQHLLEKIANAGRLLNAGLLLLEMPITNLLFGKSNPNPWRRWFEGSKNSEGEELVTKGNKRKWLVIVPLGVTGALEIYSETRKWWKKKPQASYLSNNFLGNFYDRHSEQELIDSLRAKKLRINSELGRSIIFGIIDAAIIGSYLGIVPWAKSKITTDLIDIGKIRKGIKARLSARYLTTGNSFYSKHPHLDRALQAITRVTPFTRPQVDAAFAKFKTVTGIPNKWLGKRREGYGLHLLQTMFASLSHLGIMEGYLHDWNWNNIKNNSDSVIIDILSSVFFAVFTSWAIFGSKKNYYENFFPLKKVFTRPRQELITVPIVNDFSKQTLKMGSIGLVGMLVSQSVLKGIQHSQGNDSRSWEDILKLTIYGTLYIAIISNLRSNLLAQFRGTLGTKPSPPGGEVFHFIAAQTNSAGGQWLWIVLKEKYKEQVNFSGHRVAPADELFLVKDVSSKKHSSQLFDFIDKNQGSSKLPKRVLNNF